MVFDLVGCICIYCFMVFLKVKSFMTVLEASKSIQ